MSASGTTTCSSIFSADLVILIHLGVRAIKRCSVILNQGYFGHPPCGSPRSIHRICLGHMDIRQTSLLPGSRLTRQKQHARMLRIVLEHANLEISEYSLEISHGKTVPVVRIPMQRKTRAPGGEQEDPA